MTRKDYILIAQALRAAIDNRPSLLYDAGILLASEYIIEYLANDDPDNFDRAKFVEIIREKQ